MRAPKMLAMRHQPAAECHGPGVLPAPDCAHLHPGRDHLPCTQATAELGPTGSVQAGLMYARSLAGSFSRDWAAYFGEALAMRLEDVTWKTV